VSSGRECSFYQYPKTLAIRGGIGYCDLVGEQTSCDGDSHFCKNFDLLKEYFLKQMETEGALEWGEEKRCPLFRQPKILSFGKGIGYCDVDRSSMTCKGNVKFCEKPEACPKVMLRRRNARSTSKSETLLFQLESSGQKIPRMS
jgi:hypothetical protein